MAVTERLKVWLPIALVLAGMAGAWALVAHKPALTQNTAAIEAPLVTVITATPQSLRLNVASQGVVKPRTEIHLVTEVSGKIIYLHPDFLAGGFLLTMSAWWR